MCLKSNDADEFVQGWSTLTLEVNSADKMR